MTPDEIVSLFDRRDRGWELRDPGVLAAPYAEDAVVESPISGKATGRKEIEEAYDRLLRSWSPLAYTREDLLIDGQRVAVCFEVRATHSGEFFRLPATGKKFTLRGVTIAKVGDDQILHERRVYDFTGLLVRLGVLKATVSY